ncbi:hypothetical protein HY623_04050 [Candidatus Uhrbacteria bacterium]|nr:hypothetical protein [Candidatus Uhrbacteria bacterium]
MNERGKQLSWNGVFDGWRRAEEELWRPVYSGFGWESWDAWRQMMIGDLRLEGREWFEYEIEHPHTEIPHYSIGGWNGWKKYRPAEKDIALFSDIAIPPETGDRSYDGDKRIDVRTNDKVKSLIGCVDDTTIIGFHFPDCIAILDGTHRCTAIAVEAQDGRVVSHGRFTIRLARFDSSDAGLLRIFCTDRPRSKKV